MYPVVLLYYVYPFLVPPFSPPSLSSPRRLVNAALRQGTYTGTQEFSAGYFPSNRKNERQLSITFPVPPTYSQSLKKENDFCFTYDGRTGSCRQRQQCRYFAVNSPWRSAEIITMCRPDRTLICCPDKPRSFLPRPTAKPYTSSRNEIKQEISKGNPAPVKPVETKLSELVNATRNLGTDCKQLIQSNTIGLVNSSGTYNIKQTPSPNPSSLNVVSDFDFNSPDAQKVCGLFDPKQQSSWPWIVSIGHKYSNDTIEWACLGSLITTEYILTTAHCLQRSPTVVAIGNAFVGVMTAQEYGNDISSIAESIQMDKYVNSTMYKNLGLVRLTRMVNVSSRVSPICFPFLAGVLDIIEFSGSDVQSLSVQLSADFYIKAFVRYTATHNNPGSNQKFEIRDYRVVNNTFCSSTAKHNEARLKRNFPKGIKQHVMCITPFNIGTSTELEGAPLVLLDQASDAEVIIGVSMGVSTFALNQTTLLFYTRVNAFSSWVRDNVGELPTPVSCYV